MKRIILITVLSLTLLLLAACNSPATPAVVSAPEQTVPDTEAPQTEANAPQVVTGGPGETVVDEQGAVVVSVRPLTLDKNAATLDFEVAMNTHSVDLGMDLAQLATLTTDNGTEVTAGSWNGAQGGHHVAGVLSFPVEGDGTALLDEATTVTLTLQNIDVPVRTFTWTLN